MLWLMLMGIVFRICGIPYWLLLNSHLGALPLDVGGKQFDRVPGLWLSFGAIIIGNFWNAWRAGYASMANDQLTQRFDMPFWSLLVSAGAMPVVMHLGSAAAQIALESRPLLRERIDKGNVANSAQATEM
jgi:hypothetical protein